MGTLRKAYQLSKIPDRIPSEVLATAQGMAAHPFLSRHKPAAGLIFKYWMIAAENGWLHGAIKLRPIKKLDALVK